MEVGKREIIFLSLHFHHQNDFCIKVGSNESHFHVSLIVRDKFTRQCPQITTFEVKGEPKQIRTEVPLLTSLLPYCQAKPAHTARGWVSFCCLTSMEARRPIRDGDEWEKGTEEQNLETGTNPEDQGCDGPLPEQQDVKAVSVQQCAASTAPQNCCSNCYAEQNHKDNVRWQGNIHGPIYRSMGIAKWDIVQELCESWGGRPGLSVLTSLMVSMDIKQYWVVLMRHWSQLVPNKVICQLTSEYIKHHLKKKKPNEQAMSCKRVGQWAGGWWTGTPLFQSARNLSFLSFCS